MKRKLIVIPYRDSFFLNDFGYAVRDLQIVLCISKKKIFDEIIFINRPTSIYERILGKRKKCESIPGTINITSNSFDLISPLFGRNWMKYCYNRFLLKELKKDFDGEIWVLDFSPFAIIPIIDKENIFYWHDMIDNFTKHNRFSKYSKQLVRQKYDYVADKYDFLTGVSNGAIDSININNKFLLNNGVFIDPRSTIEYSEINVKKYDFGFCGFITDKTDIYFLKELIQKGYSIVFHGKCFDERLKKQLMDIGIVVTGQFRYYEMASKMSTFKIGLIPYIKEKSHDESPLKIYEYLKYNKPCLASISYEVNSPYVVNYNEKKDSLYEVISKFLTESGNDKICNSIQESWYLESKLDTVLSQILK